MFLLPPKNITKLTYEPQSRTMWPSGTFQLKYLCYEKSSASLWLQDNSCHFTMRWMAIFLVRSSSSKLYIISNFLFLFFEWIPCFKTLCLGIQSKITMNSFSHSFYNQRCLDVNQLQVIWDDHHYLNWYISRQELDIWSFHYHSDTS